MAQRTRTISRRARLLARRYGLVGKAGAAVVCVALVIACAGARILLTDEAGVTLTRTEGQVHVNADDSAPTTTDDAPGDADPAPLVVHVDGAVVAPGVYELLGQSPRVNDAIVCAGGLTAEADTTAVNLAAPVNDGQKVHIPFVGEIPPETQQVAQPGMAPAGENGTASSPVSQPGLVNINTASREELQSLTGVGEATASAIVEDREQNGAFVAPEDLMRVSGIGEKKFAKIRDSICV